MSADSDYCIIHSNAQQYYMYNLMPLRYLSLNICSKIYLLAIPMPIYYVCTIYVLSIMYLYKIHQLIKHANNQFISMCIIGKNRILCVDN